MPWTCHVLIRLAPHFHHRGDLGRIGESQGHQDICADLIGCNHRYEPGEILGLLWQDIDLEGQRLAIRQVLEQTKSRGLHFKEPKTHQGCPLYCPAHCCY